jgi:hypothetical protein
MLTIKNWFTFDLCNLKNHDEITIKWFRSVFCLGNPIDVWPHPINFSAKMQPTERLRRPIAGLKWSQPTPQSAFQNYNHDYTLTWQWKIPKINLIEATNPNACFKNSHRRRVPTEQWKTNRRCSIALKTTLAEHSCLTLLLDNRVGHSFVTLLLHTLVGHSCGTLLWETLVGHSCLTLLLDTLVALVKLSLNPLKHSCKTLLLDTLAWHIWNTSQYTTL